MQVVSHPPKAPSRGPGKTSGRGSTLAFALAAGLAAALLAFLLVRGRLPAKASTPVSVSVVVAARDIPARTRLTAKWLGVRSIAPSQMPDGAVGSVAELKGKVTTEGITQGAAVTLASVTASSAALGMAFALPPSQRAMTVTLDPADSPSLFARPGDHVDLLATDAPNAGLAEAHTVLQNVKLLAVGDQTLPDAAPSSPTPSGAAHVTVAVSPAQAQVLAQAAARGKLHLSLRPADDETIAALPVFPVMPTVRDARPAPVRRTKPKKEVPEAKEKEPEEALPLPPLPMHLAPVPPPHVSVIVIKGSQSQTVSVEP